MRITLNIAEDVLYAVKERARRENRSAGEVLSDLAREAMTRRVGNATAAENEPFYGFRPFPRRGRPISNELIDRLRAEQDG
jgi:hypothetical protein